MSPSLPPDDPPDDPPDKRLETPLGASSAASSLQLWTCRHGSESVLSAELVRAGVSPEAVSVLCPGLLQVETVVDSEEPSSGTFSFSIQSLDPIWALQTMPEARRIEETSVRALGREVARYLRDRIDGIEGAWDLHALVPGHLKGTLKPKMARRASLVVQAALEELRRTRRRAHKQRVQGGQALLALGQVMLLQADLLFVSWSPCRPLPAGGRWPSPLVAGLAPVPDEPAAPSSAFRKLEEALSSVERWPRAGERVVDLGASPGGWTHVMRRYGARVVAVDRSPLSAALMNDSGVTFVRGDAFAYVPEAPVDWLVSDIIAYPKRVSELLERWCAGRWAEKMIVQMKFQGAPDFDALEAALEIARGHGYGARARHFFNDKNEATLMIQALPR